MNRFIARTLIAVAVAAALPVYAQTPPAAPDGARQHTMRSPTQRIEERIAYLQNALAINDAQQTLWTAYTQVLRTQAQAAEQRMQQWRDQGAQGQKPNAVQRMELQQSMLAESGARLNELLAVTRPLYAALSPEQQQVADKLLVPPGPGMMHHRRPQRGA